MDASPATRRLLRAAAAQIAAEPDEDGPVELPAATRAEIRRIDAAVDLLLAEAAALFTAYGLFAEGPSSIRAVFVFGGSRRLVVHVSGPSVRLHESISLRGTLREIPLGGGAVRAVEVRLCRLAWDPALGLVPEHEGDDAAAPETALDALVTGLLRALHLA